MVQRTGLQRGLLGTIGLFHAVSAIIQRRLHQMSLLRRLLVLELVVFLALFIGVLIVLDQVTGSLEGTIREERLVLAQAVAAGLDSQIRFAGRELEQLAGLVDSAGDKSALPGLKGVFDLAYRHNVRILNRGIFVMDGAGAVLLADSGHPAPPIDVPVLSQAITGSPYVSRDGPLRAWALRDTSGGVILALAVPVGSEVSGRWVVGLIDALNSGLATALDLAVRLGETGHAEIVDAGGKAVLATDNGHLLRASDHPSSYRALLRQGQVVCEIMAYERSGGGPPGEAHVMAFVPLGSLPWGLGLGGTVSETFAPARDMQRNFLAILGGLAGVGVIATIVGAKKLVQPVLVLQNTARRIAAGDLEPPIAVTAGGEIGRMAESLEAMRAKLQAWGLELEQRVRQRTAELEQRNRELATTAAVAEAVGSSLKLDTVLEKAMDQVLEMPGAHAAVVYLSDGGSKGKGPLHPHVYRGVTEGFVSDPRAMECAGCSAENAILAGEIVQRGRSDANGDGHSPACLKEEFSGVASVPLRSVNRTVGVMCVLSRDTVFSPSDLKVLQVIGYQLGMAVENSGLYEELSDKEHRLRLLLEKVLGAQEEERQRVARELHDETGQALTAIAMGLDSLEKQAGRQSSSSKERIQLLRRLSQDALVDLRKLVMALRPTVLDDMGLVSALRRYSDQHLTAQSIKVAVQARDLSERLDRSIEVVVFRIVQEAINNVARHSGATEAVITLSRTEKTVTAVVRDNGRGFNLEETTRYADGSGGLGLLGMQERAELVGGTLTIQSAQGAGTEIRLEIPLASKKEV